MRTTVYILLILVTALSCKQAYNPRPISQATNYLVVEGAINTGTDSTIIRLSRTVPISSSARTTPELGAVVTIVSDGGASYPCIEAGNGYYKAAGLNVTTGRFGLKISTSGGKVYQSDLVPVKNSPPIDSVYYRIQGNGLEIYADTHDPANNTRYYRWDYAGTYEFHSAFKSLLYLQTVPVDSVKARPLANQIYICWRNDISSSILINSSEKLAADVITKNPIQFLSSSAEELENRYSILVKQYALTADAYNYYTQLKKNTEQLGGVFDPQPSQLTGNIRCISNPGEPVLGYITAGSAAEERIYINNRNLPAWLASTPYNQCLLDTDLYNQPSGKTFINTVETRIYSGFDVPVSTIERPKALAPDGYTGSTAPCVDCTLRGTNQKPDFWTEE
ncbi:MAG: DUF4249 domain-containing protein [Mucilaginibacter sp.]